MNRFLVYLMALCLTALPLVGQEMSARARLIAQESGLAAGAGGYDLTLSLSQAVPYRAFTLSDPNRLILDFREVTWAGLDRSAFMAAGPVSNVRAGRYQAGWSRIVFALEEPLAIRELGMETGGDSGAARVRARLVATDQDSFDSRTGAPAATIWGEPEVAQIEAPITRQAGDRPFVVMIDPGHGGIDPGAEAEGMKEADIMLQFARALKEELLRSGGFEVHLTRDDDVFVSLDRRVQKARAVRADLFLSLHADALAEGEAHGATIYTLSEEASDAAAAGLAARHDRGDLLAGVDLNNHDDVVAGVLMDLARLETAPRSERLAEQLVTAIQEAGGQMHKRPHQRAGFSVLKAPDIPSVLIELGFLSSTRDRNNLQDETWRAATVASIRAGLQLWVVQDAAEAQLLRR